MSGIPSFRKEGEAMLYGCLQLKTKLRGLSPRANYTDRVTFACRRFSSFDVSGCHVVSETDPCGRILGFLDRNPYFCCMAVKNCKLIIIQFSDEFLCILSDNVVCKVGPLLHVCSYYHKKYFVTNLLECLGCVISYAVVNAIKRKIKV
jgi:hypothetical protein